MTKPSVKLLLTDVIALIGLAVYLVLIVALAGNLSNSFQIIDGHDDLIIHHNIQQDGFIHALKDEMAFRLNHRFLPFHSLLRITKSYFFGTNWTLHYLYLLILGVITIGSFYWAGRLSGWAVLAALAFSFFTFFGFESWFNQATIFFRISSGELPGMFLIGLSLVSLLYAAKRENLWNKWDLLFLLFITLATLTKESFIVFTPALLFWKVWAYSRNHDISIWNSLKKHWMQITLIGLICLAEVGIVVLLIGTSKMGYVGVSGDSSQFAALLLVIKKLLTGEQTINILLSALAMALPILAVTYHELHDTKDKPAKIITQYILAYWPQIALIGLIALPQIVLYSKSGIYERYKLPLIMAVSFPLAGLIHIVFSSPKKFLLVKIMLSLILALSFYRITVNTFANSKSYSYGGKQIEHLFSAIEHGTDKRILVLADPVLEFENGVSVIRYLHYHKQAENAFLLPVSIGKNEHMFASSDPEFHKQLVKDLKSIVGEFYLPPTDTAAFDYVIYHLDEMEEIYLKQQDWYHRPHKSIPWDDGAVLIYE